MILLPPPLQYVLLTYAPVNRVGPSVVIESMTRAYSSLKWWYALSVTDSVSFVGLYRALKDPCGFSV